MTTDIETDFAPPQIRERPVTIRERPVSAIRERGPTPSIRERPTSVSATASAASNPPEGTTGISGAFRSFVKGEAHGLVKAAQGAESLGHLIADPASIVSPSPLPQSRLITPERARAVDTAYENALPTADTTSNKIAGFVGNAAPAIAAGAIAPEAVIPMFVGQGAATGAASVEDAAMAARQRGEVVSPIRERVGTAIGGVVGGAAGFAGGHLMEAGGLLANPAERIAAQTILGAPQGLAENIGTNAAAKIVDPSRALNQGNNEAIGRAMLGNAAFAVGGELHGAIANRAEAPQIRERPVTGQSVPLVRERPIPQLPEQQPIKPQYSVADLQQTQPQAPQIAASTDTALPVKVQDVASGSPEKLPQTLTPTGPVTETTVKAGVPKPERTMQDVQPTRIAPGDLELQLRNQVMQHFGPDVADLGSHPKAAAAWRGDEPSGRLISAARARDMAATLPEDHPARITLHNLKELEKNPAGTRLKSINTNDAQDGTRVVVNDGETFTIDKENQEIADGIRAPIPDGGINVYGKQVLPPSEGKVPKGEFAPPEKFTDQSQPGVFGQPTIASSGVGKQSGLFHEPVKLDVPHEKAVGSAEANRPENTGEMFPRLSGGRQSGAVRLPETPEWVDKLVEKAGEMKPAERAKDLAQGIRDFVSIDPVLALKRAGAADAAWEHATAREAVPHMVNDLLARVFPKSYKDPEAMGKTIDIINKDNILGGLDTFQKRAKELRAQAKQKNLFGRTEAAAELEQQAKRAEDSAFAIEAKHDIPKLDKAVREAAPEIKANIARWKQHVNPELDRLYNEMKRVDPGMERDSRGRHFDTRINLLHQGEEGLWAEKLGEEPKPVPGTPGRANIHTNPNVKRDRFDQAAKFTGDYSTDAQEVLSNVLGPRHNEVTKLRFYDSLVKRGVAKLVEQGGTKPEMIQGKPAKWMSVDMPVTDPKTGKTTRQKQGLVVRADLAGEIHQILDTSQRLPTNPIFKAMTAVQLAQIADATSHAKNLLSVVSNAQGAKSAWADVVRKMPLVGSGDAVKRIFDVSREVNADTPAIRTEIAQMAKQGLIRPEYPATGIQKITHGQQMLHKLDTGARIVMNRFFDNLVERGLAKDTPMNRRNFVSQVGVYNRRLMSPFMRAARDYGISPFVVAGRNFNRQGRRILTGEPGFETTGKAATRQVRATQFIGTTLSLAVVPMMLNAITTGKPGGRSGTPIGAWDLGNDNEDGSHKVLDLLQMTGVRRGLRSTGLDALLTGLREGKDLNTITGNAITDVAQSAAHPWVGPGLGGVYATLTGHRLDLRGKMEAQQIPEGGGKQYVENARAALQSQNPLLYSMVRPILKGVGVDQTPDESGTASNIGKTFLKSPLSAFGVKDVRPGTSAAEDLAARLTSNKMGEGMSPEVAQNVVAHRQILNQLKTNPDQQHTILDDAIADGKLNPKEASVLAKKAGMTPLQWNVRGLSAQDAAKVYGVATADQKKLLSDQVRDKVINSTLPYDKQDALLKDMGIEKPAGTDLDREMSQLRATIKEKGKFAPEAIRLKLLERQKRLQKGPKQPK